MNSKLVNLAGIGVGVALASGCISRGTATFPGGTAEPDLSRPGENPMPQAVSPVQPGNVVYPAPQPEKKPEYWEQVNDPYAELSKGRPYIGQGFVIAPPAGTAAGTSVYVVKSGDTFGGIAQRNRTTVKALKAANPGIDYDKIRVGQKINIPAATASSAKASSSASSAPQAGVHIVKSGDILGRIASQYGVKVADLKAANGLTSDKITVGQKLRIPGKAAATTSSAAAPAKATTSGTIEVAPPSSATPPPDVPETATPSLEIAPPSLEPPAPQPITAGAAADATTVYLANGRQDLYNIAVEKTISIGEIERLNPSLAGNRSRILPAGTPVVLPAR